MTHNHREAYVIQILYMCMILEKARRLCVTTGTNYPVLIDLKSKMNVKNLMSK